MIIREKYLEKLVKARDTEFIKVITGVRRCGKSMLLNMYKEYLIKDGVNENNIIHINFENNFYSNIKDSNDLCLEIENKLQKGKNYILLDEVQMVSSWEKAVNSLNLNENIDIYITGSNAYLLSSELHTLLSGRYLEFKIYPLSFKEFLLFNDYDLLDLDTKFNEYLKISGLPAANTIKDDEYLLGTYLKDIYSTIVKKDIMDKNNIKNSTLLENILLYLISNIGSSISSNKISDYLVSNKIVDKSNHTTIDSYLKMLENSFIIYKVNRSDVRSKEIFKTLGKYYLCDLGIRNALLGYRNVLEGHLLENIVYLELLRQGYSVSIGKNGEYEVDFIAESMTEVKYIQVVQSISDESVLKRETRSLENIDDNYEKIILTMDKSFNLDIKGIKIVNIIDFLVSE